MDYLDFVANPGKYKMFKTAKIKGHIFTHNSEDDLNEDEIVGIKYVKDYFNRLFRRVEPVYLVTLAGGKVWGELNGGALKDFVL